MLPVGSPGADGGHHRLLDEVDLGRLGLHRRIAHGAFLHLGDLAGNADDDSRAHTEGPVVSLLDEVVEHLLCVLEIGDDAVLHRPDGHDVAGGPPEHLLGLATHRLDAAGLLVDRDDGRLADDDSPPLAEHQ